VEDFYGPHIRTMLAACTSELLLVIGKCHLSASAFQQVAHLACWFSHTAPTTNSVTFGPQLNKAFFVTERDETAWDVIDRTAASIFLLYVPLCAAGFSHSLRSTTAGCNRLAHLAGTIQAIRATASRRAVTAP
jgi:hypothetical protein